MLKIADTTFLPGCLFTGTQARYPGADVGGAGGLRLTAGDHGHEARRSARWQRRHLAPLQQLGVRLPPNTSGAKRPPKRCSPPDWRAKRSAPTAKLEIHPDVKYLPPDPRKR